MTTFSNLIMFSNYTQNGDSLWYIAVPFKRSWPSPINCSPSPYLPIITIRHKRKIASHFLLRNCSPRTAQATRTLDHPQVSHSMSGTSRAEKIASFVGRTQDWGYAIPSLALRNRDDPEALSTEKTQNMYPKQTTRFYDSLECLGNVAIFQLYKAGDCLLDPSGLGNPMALDRFMSYELNTFCRIARWPFRDCGQKRMFYVDVTQLATLGN